MSWHRGPGSHAVVMQAVRNKLRRAVLTVGLISNLYAALAAGTSSYSAAVYVMVLPSQAPGNALNLAMAATLGVIGCGILTFLRDRACMLASHDIIRHLDGPVLAAALETAAEGRSGEAMEAVRDLSFLRDFATGDAIMMPVDMAMAPIYLLVIFWLGWPLGLLSVVFVLIMLSLNLVTMLATSRLLDQANRGLAQVLSALPMLARRSEAIRGLGMRPAVAGRFDGQMRHALAAADRGERRLKAMAATTHTLRYAMIGVMVGVGALLTIEGVHLIGGSFLGAALLIPRILAPFDHLHGSWNQWVRAAAGIGRLRRLLAATEGRRQQLALPPPNGPLLVDRLVHLPRGCDQPVLKGVSLQVEPGEAAVVVGPSGSGKSTLARLLVGVWRPTGGGVYLGGTSTFLWERQSFGRAVGYLPQRIQLLNGSVVENIARFGEPIPAQVFAAARAAGLHDLIAALPYGYETPVDDTTPLLSGGQKQLLALARALYGDPALLVLDEPNSNLDEAGEATLLGAVAAAKARGARIVIVAHRSAVLDIADKVVVLRDGRVERVSLRDGGWGQADGAGQVPVPAGRGMPQAVAS